MADPRGNPGALPQLETGNAVGLPPEFAGLLQQLQPPEQQSTEGPGALQTFLGLLAGSLGGAAVGDPTLGPNLIKQQQQRLQQAERDNRAALVNFQNQRLDIIGRGLEAKRRSAESTADRELARRTADQRNEIEKERNEIRRLELATSKLEKAGKIDTRLALTVLDQGAALSSEVTSGIEQLKAQLTDPENFEMAITLDKTTFTTPENVRAAFQERINILLEAVQDPATRARLEKQFNATFGRLDRQLKEVERRQGIAQRKPEARERAAKATETGILAKPSEAAKRQAARVPLRGGL